MNVRHQLCLAALLLAVGMHFVLSSASKGAEATPAKEFKVLPGFKVDRLLSVDRSRFGSWVSMTVDNKGRLIVSDQGGKLHRLTLQDSGEPKIETLPIDAGAAHGLLYAFDSLYVMGKSGGKTGLFRLRDTNNDDQFDKIETLRTMPVGSEHGAHAIVPGPDGKSIYICGGNMTRFPTPDFDTSRPPRVWKNDSTLKQMPDAKGHNTGAHPIGGWVARLDPDGKNLELICNGFRNEYDIAFNPEGELFTYDSDMEWDIGAAWYRPTRVCHLTSGAEFGWRYGTGKWPEYFADSLPAVVDVGPGSPTGIVFGTGAKFPAKYQKALFIGDWSYGLIYAVHLKPEGSSYTGTVEQFATAAPLAVTDMIVHSKDGALYFITGGRNCQSGLYRMTYTGKESTEPVKYEPEANLKERELRRKLEELHRPNAKEAVKTAWPYLNHEDRHLRFAARLAVEHQPVDAWKEMALAEPNDRARIHAMIALARQGNPELEPKILDALGRVDWGKLSTDEKLELLRAYGLTFARMGPPDEATRKKVAAKLGAVFPATAPKVNRELCRVLAFLDADDVVAKSLDLLESSPTQEEQMHYVYCLRHVKNGWDLDRRKRFLSWFDKSGTGYRGGASFEGFLRNIRAEALANVSAEDKKALGKLAAPTWSLSSKATAIT
ncbi:MAG: heme-binding protein, partial [Gemmataceae bacterium]